MQGSISTRSRTPGPLFSAAFSKDMQTAGAILDQKTKPPGSLGTVETIAMQISAIQKTLKPDVDSALAILFAADHGVMEESVSAYPQAVTRQMLLNFASGGSAANVFCNANATALEVINVGVIGDAVDGIVHDKVSDGTANMMKQAAMSSEQLEQALAAGQNAVQRAANNNIKLIALGEMGIGNTTSAAAIVSALGDIPAVDSVGPGTGLDQKGLAHKVSIVNQILTRHSQRDPESVLKNMGGLEIAALCGAMLEACKHKITVIVDGYIVTAAALCAVGMNPVVREHLVFAHRSAEPGHIAALAQLNARPLLDLGLRLGEGSGAILAIPLVRSAVAMLNNMATFEDAGVDGAI